MTNINTPENLNAVAKTVSENGINNTLIALIIIIVLMGIGVVVGILFAVLKSNQKTTDKLLNSFEENQRKDRDAHIQSFAETNGYLRSLTEDMKEINLRYSNTIANISCLIEIQGEKINSAILNDKPQSLRDFDKQSKQIIKSIVYESIDYVL
jgi:uncharacterized membrane-anchored protein YhcB (DUF1043 family)